MARRRRRKERGRQLGRILRLIRKLEHSRTGLTLDDLCDDLKVSRRTLYRDIRALEEAGFRLESDGGIGETKKWRFTAGQRRSLSSTFTENELLSLYFCLNLTEPLKWTPLRAGVESLLDKIESTFGAKERDYYSTVLFTHVARAGRSADLRKHAATLSAISRGCLDQKKMELTYRGPSDKRPKTYLFHPYCIAYFEGQLYTVGYSERRGELRTLRVDRIVRVVETDRKFERPGDFDAEDYLLRGLTMFAGGEPADVRLEFEKHAARVMKETTFHPAQEIREKPGGKIEMSLRVSGLSEVARLVMQHAPHGRVLEPKTLREMVRDWCEAVAAKHR